MDSSVSFADVFALFFIKSFPPGFWNRMEMYCRELTKRWKEVHVISGPTTRPINEIDPDTQQEQKFVKYRVSFSMVMRNTQNMLTVQTRSSSIVNFNSYFKNDKALKQCPSIHSYGPTIQCLCRILSNI